MLDIIAVPLREPRPGTYQTENWLLDPASRWRRAGYIRWAELHGYADNPATLWLNGEKTLAGLNDRLRLASAEGLRNSLYLKLRVFAPGEAFGNPLRRLYADFEHQGIRYVLRVTDPAVEMQYLVGEDGDFPIGECFMTVSLGEPHEGYCYKLVAAVIRK